MRIGRVDLTGETFERLTVLGRSTQNRWVGKATRWECRCICGGACASTTWNLTRGKTQSCGCLRKDNNGGHPLRLYESLYNTIASKSKWPVNLTYEDFVEFTKISKCHYCLASINWGPKLGYHLDRMDSSAGYSKENCVVCCPRCNWGKRNAFSYEEWYGMTEYLRRKQCANPIHVSDQGYTTFPKTLLPKRPQAYSRANGLSLKRKFRQENQHPNSRRSSAPTDKSTRFPQN
jgi:hypothetical protein